MTDKHTYPPKYLPGTHWATDAAWEILDMLKPGAISAEDRAWLAGCIAGRLVRERRDVLMAAAEERLEIEQEDGGT